MGTDETRLHCCYIPDEEQDKAGQGGSMATAERVGCKEAADYEIRDLADSDPYVSITHACTEHVGEMLGHADLGNWNQGEPEHWEVVRL